jgi:hypothetical protein
MPPLAVQINERNVSPDSYVPTTCPALLIPYAELLPPSVPRSCIPVFEDQRKACVVFCAFALTTRVAARTKSDSQMRVDFSIYFSEMQVGQGGKEYLACD